MSHVQRLIRLSNRLICFKYEFLVTSFRDWAWQRGINRKQRNGSEQSRADPSIFPEQTYYSSQENEFLENAG